jgi:hypothetical protein
MLQYLRSEHPDESQGQGHRQGLAAALQPKAHRFNVEIEVRHQQQRNEAKNEMSF